MKSIPPKLLALATMPLLFVSGISLRASDMNERIESSIQIMHQKQHSDEPIPAELLSHAKGVAVFSITKVGLGIGGQGGGRGSSRYDVLIYSGIPGRLLPPSTSAEAASARKLAIPMSSILSS